MATVRYKATDEFKLADFMRLFPLDEYLGITLRRHASGQLLTDSEVTLRWVDEHTIEIALSVDGR